MLPPELAHFQDYGWLLNWFLRGVGYAGSKYGDWKSGRAEGLENRILDYLNTKVDATGSSVGALWATVIIRPIIEDVPFGMAFPPQLTGLAKFKHELRRLPYEARHRWRVFTGYVPEQKVADILLTLLRENRVGYNRSNQHYYSLHG